MKRWIIGAATAVLVSCGSSSSGTTYNGGINGTPPGGSSGFTFTPVDGGGLIVGQTSCTIPGTPPTPVKVSGLLLGFSSYSGMCGFVRNHGIGCTFGGKSSSTIIGIGIFDVDAFSAAAIPPGTYGMNTQVAAGATGFFVTEGSVSVTNGTCVESGPDPLSLGGTITITSASAAEVKGSVNLTWTGGGFSGPFDVVGCTANVDVCGLANGTTTCANCL